MYIVYVTEITQRRPGFHPWPVLVGIFVDKMARGRVFVQVSEYVIFFLSIFFLPVIHTHTSLIYHRCYIISAVDTVVK
jgi:hypothetical protein